MVKIIIIGDEINFFVVYFFFFFFFFLVIRMRRGLMV